jgi:hypothetical protein
MTLLNGQASLDKLNLYRVGVNQPKIQLLAQAPPQKYCQMTAQTTFNRIQANAAVFKNTPGPPGSMNLYDFLVNIRFPVTIGPAGNGGLDCTNMGVANPFLNPNLAVAPLVNNNNMLVIVLASTLGALVFIGLAAGAFVVVRRRKMASATASNFMAL